MATESVIWTALPHGVDDTGGFLRVTAFVSPRLTTDTGGSRPLGDFPAFKDWPQTCSQLKFAAEFDGAGTFAAEPDPLSDTPRSPLWQLLCRPGSVIDHAFTDLSKRQIRSIPVRAVSGTVLGLYAQIAETSPTEFPPVLSGPLLQLGRQLGGLGDQKRELYRALDRLMAQEVGPGEKRGRFINRSTPGSSTTQAAFAEAYRFYDRPGTRDPAGPKNVPDKPKPPPIDFHKFCALCGDYPVLLRRLGLAIDLLVKREPAIAASGRLRIVVTAAPIAFKPWMTADAARPWTHYEIVGRRFIASSKDKQAGDLVDGMLRLESEDAFLVNQIDVDGSAMKTVDFFANVVRLAAHLGGQQRSMSEDASSLPALRTGGFTVSRDDRAARTVHHLDDVADHESKRKAGAAADLFAEDVTRGFRIDAEDAMKPDRWLSLCRRVGIYTAAPPGQAVVPIDTIADEGYVKGGSTTSAPNDPNTLYLHETMFGWDGWSLTAKRPGQTIVDNAVGSPPPNNTTEFPLITQFTPAPGTLPRLRFKRGYRFRARAVDMAGNSVAEKEIVPQHVTRQHTFVRFDPVPSPAVMPRRPYGEGESLMRMVIRSTLGMLPAAYVAQTRISGLHGHTTPLSAYIATCERHLAPPHASQQLAEWHGRFDVAVGGASPQASVDAQFNIAARESGTFLDPAPGAFVFNPKPTETPTNLATRAKGAPLKPGEYVCHDIDKLVLPYLPDPLALGASFTTLPGDAGTRLQNWVATAWPDVQPFRIRIENGSGAPSFKDDSPRALVVQLPQAEMVTVRLASFMEKKDLELMGQWMRESSATRSQQQADAEQGRHWMLTPWQLLTLVHAVEKPLEAPVVDVPTDGLQRLEGETFAVVTGAIDNHAKSTGRLDIEANWDEPIDDLVALAPDVIKGRAHVADFLIEASETACRIGRDDAAPTASQPTVHRVRHEFHDTKHRWVKYNAIATTRFREYFPPAITDHPDLITNVGPEVLRSVPSSRRPDPPAIKYVVPTWTWTERRLPGIGFAGGNRTLLPTEMRTRSGGGLRVYLERPWYSSGADELLGVVIADQPWITFPFDIAAGMVVRPADRAAADELATKVFDAGLAKGAGPPSAPPSRQLAEALAQLSERAAGPPHDPGEASPQGFADISLDAAFATARTDLDAERTAAVAALMRAAGGQQTRSPLLFSREQQKLLADMTIRFFPPSGDPQKFITHWGLDPIWGSAGTDAGPYIHQFPLRVAVGTGISLLEAPGHTVTVVGHQPKFDPSRKLWYCDLQLDAGAAYFPFVRLALARYQPFSIAGRHLSRVVLADFAQLVAERRAAFTKIGTSAVRVSLRGPGGYTDNAKQFGQLKHSTGLDNVTRLSRFALAQFEQLPPGATTDLAWVPVGEEVRLDLSAGGGLDDIRYSGTVPLPTVGQGFQLRLALREYEVFGTDEAEADDHFVAPLIFVLVRQPVRYRLVYASHFAL
jgi:hypothetical protein